MSLFLTGSVLLALTVAALLLFPGRRSGPRPADGDDPNLQWYRQRREELQGDDSLLEEAKLRLLEEGITGKGGSSLDAAPASAGRSRLAWVLLPLILIGAGLIYRELGAVEDVLIYRQLQNLNPEDRGALEDLRTRIASRSAKHPENLQYLDLLGQLQLTLQDYTGAAASYERLAELAPQDPAMQAQAAQTRFLAQERQLDPEAQLYAERALALDPNQRTALGLLGMASFERGQYTAAVTYWERLQALEAPGSPAYQMLDDVLSLARSRAPQLAGDAATVEAPAAAGTPAAEGAAAAEGAPAAEGEPAAKGEPAPGDAPGITLRVSLAPGSDVPPQATVFVFARNPDAASRMPIAVRRLSASRLPLTLRLGDADSMAGQMLSTAGDVVVSAQLSRNGQPGEANADFLARTGPLRADDSGRVIELVLSPRSD